MVDYSLWIYGILQQMRVKENYSKFNEKRMLAYGLTVHACKILV